MKWNFKRLSITIVLSMLLVVSGIPFVPGNLLINAEQNTTVTILNTNDVHGYSGSEYKGNVLQNIGADYIKNIKDSTPNAILVDAGDNTQGMPFSGLSKGSYSIKMMNAANYDVATLGNHEFDYGVEQLLTNVNNAKFPFISANTYYGNDLFLKGIKESTNGDNIIIEKSGKKIGFFGITTAETALKTYPGNFKGVTFKSEISTSQEQVNELKQKGVDIIVGIMHVGIEATSDPTSHKIAEQVNDLDIIIDGHSHSKDLTKIEKQNQKPTYVIQTGTQSKNLGKIEIKFQNNDYSIETSLLSSTDIQSTYKADENITNLYNDLNEKNQKILKRTLSHSEKPLYAGTYNGIDICRVSETNLGNLVSDSMFDNAKKNISDTKYANLPAVCLQNGGGVRTIIDSGYISYEDIISVLPFINKVSVKLITPNVLYEALEHGVSAIELPKNKGEGISGLDGRFPQVSGMRFEFDPAQSARNKTKGQEGSRVTAVYLKNNDGTETLLNKEDAETKMVFISNNFETEGMDGYDMLIDLPLIFEGEELSFALQDYVINKTYESAKGLLEIPFIEHRVVMKRDPEIFSNFDAKITVIGLNGTLKNTNVLIGVDGGEAKYMMTDQNGQIVIPNLTSGLHEIYANYEGLYEYGIVSDYKITDIVNTKQLDIILYDRSEKEIESVTNIISQIPDPEYIYDNDKEFIMFARHSYDYLDEEDKASVENYQRLLKAEQVINSAVWQLIDGCWYYKQGVSFVSGWINTISGWEGQYFYFNPNDGGAMKTGWTQDGGTNWYYCDPATGVMKTGWTQDGETSWYYCDPATGAMKTGWIQDGGTNWYYCDANGAMYAGGDFTINNVIYKFDDNGKWVESAMAA